MTDKPQLDLGRPPAGVARQRSPVRGFWVLLAFQLATLFIIVALMTGVLGRTGLNTDGAERAEEIRKTALALEERSLAAEAAAAWQDYLRLMPNAADRSEICYRVGCLLMEAGDYSAAVTSLVAAEQMGATGEELENQVGLKILECLRRLGKYGEVGRELSRQVEVGAESESQQTTLVSFAGESLTDADLDRLIENRVDQMLALQPGAISVSREQLLAQFASPEARQQILQEVLRRELFTRRARELKLDQDLSFRQSCEDLEADLLASRFMSRELEKIVPTQVDIDSYFEANRSAYQKPDTAAVVIMAIQPGQGADEVLKSIESADEFRAQARAADDGDDVQALTIQSGIPNSGFEDTSALFALDAGEWTKTPLDWNGQKVLALIESKTSGDVPDLEAIRQRVEADYRLRKRQELVQQLSADLMRRYDVKIQTRPENSSAASDPSTKSDPVAQDQDEAPDSE